MLKTTQTQMQAIFTTVATHLLDQSARSTIPDPQIDRPNCAYRGANGMKCAIGCLIPDSLYTPELEGGNVATRAVLRAAGLSEFVGLSESVASAGSMLETQEQFDFLSRLQRIHDDTPVALWGLALIKLANKYGLDASQVYYLKAYVS